MTDQTVLRVEVDPSGANRGASEVESAIGRMANSSVGFLDKLRSAFDSLTSFIRKCADVFGDFFKTLLAVDSLKGLLDRMIDVNVTFNAFIATMAVVKGSVQAANAEFKYLSDYTRLMGGNLEGNIQSYTRVAAAFQHVDKTGQATRHVFEAVSQAQTLLHTKSSDTARIFLALDQTVGRGKVSLEELQRQLGNSLPGAMDIASKAMGMTQANFRREITKGTLDPLEVVLKLANQIKVEFGGGARAVLDQFTANLNRMKQSVFELYLAVGQSGAMDGLNSVIKALTQLFNDENTGKQFGESLKVMFEDIASWISKITASDIKDFFDGLSGIVKTFVIILREMVGAFSDTVNGQADFLSFSEVVSKALIVMSDAALTVINMITMIPIAFATAYADLNKWKVQFSSSSTDIVTGKPNEQYQKDLAEATAFQDKMRNLSQKNMAIVLGTEDSPTAKMYDKVDKMFDKMRQNRAATGANPKTSSLGPDAGAPLSPDKVQELVDAGNGAPPGKPKSSGRGRDVFSSEMVSLAKAEGIAVLQYNNLMNDKVKMENKNSEALEIKIRYDKEYMKLGSEKLNQLRSMASAADQAQAKERAAEAYVADKLSMNKQIYSSEQELLDITEYRNGAAEKNQRAMQERFLFDAKYLAMGSELKNSLMDQAKAADALAVAVASAQRVEQSRYSTLIGNLQTQRNIENQSRGLGVSKYIEEQKILDSFLKGGANQFATLSEAASLWADALQRDMDAINSDLSEMSFNIDEQIRQYEFEADTIGNTSVEIQKLTGVKKLYDQMRLNGLDLTLEENKAYKEMVDLMANKLTRAIDAVAARQADWTNGLKSGVASYIDSISNIADSVSQAVSGAFKGLEDMFVDFVTTGKASFTDFAKSVVADIARIVVQMQITGPIAAWFRDQMSGAGSSWGGAASSLASAAGGASGGGAIGSLTQAYGLYNNASKLYNTVAGFFGAGAATSMGVAGATGVTAGALGAATSAGAITGAGAATGAGLTLGGGISAGAAGVTGITAGSAGAGAIGAGVGTSAAAGGAATAAGSTGLMSGLAAIPVWGWIAAAILAVVTFGLGGDKQITGGGFQGTVRDRKFSGNAYQTWEEDGGWFGLDEEGRDLSKLPDAVSKSMNESIDAMFLSFDKMGDALKLGSGFLNDFTSEVDVNLTGLKPEEQQAAVDRALKQTSDNMATAFLDKFRDSIVTRKVTPAHSTNPSGESDGEFVWIDEVVETTTRAQQAAHSSIDAYISDVLRITDVFREGSYGVVDAEGRYSDFVKVIVGMASMFADTNGLSSIFGESIDFKVLEANAKAGESVIDTFNRLNNLFTSTNSVAAGMGKAVESAFGAVGLSSIEMRQKLVDAAGGTEELQKSFAAYSSTYLDSFKQLEPVFQAVADASKSAGVYIGESKDQFVAQVNALDLTTEAGVKMYAELMKIAPMFAQMADSIANATVAFDDVFLTDTEKAAKANQKLADQFAKLGYTGVTTVDQFRKIVDAIDRTTVSGQAMYVALSQLAPAFANMAKSANASLGADRKAEVLARRQAQALTNTPAVEVDQDFLNAQREMEVALLKAQGREEEALNLSRKNSLATMDPQLRAMQQSIWAAEDQADAVQKAADLAEKAMEQLQSNVDKAFDLLTRSVDAQKDTLRTAYDSQVKTIQDNLKVQQDLARTQSKTASESLKSIQSILNSLNDAMKSTEVDSYQLSGVRRRAAQSTLSNALTASNAGASLTNFEGLDEALKTIAKPSEDLFATFVDYSRDQGRTAAIIEGLQINANAQVSVAQLTLDAINGSIDTIQDTAQSQIDALTATYEGEITRLDNILLEAKNSIDALRGIDTSVVSVEAAIVTLTAAIGAAQTAAAEQAAIASQNLQNLLTASSNTTAAASSQTASIQSVNGGMITYDQLNQMQAQAQQRNVMDIANAFMSSDPAVVSAMRDRLGAGSSDAIMNDPNFWSQAMAGGSNDPRIWRMLNAAQNNQSDANTLSGADLQRVMQSRWASLGIASYDVGAPYVDGDQIAMIHNRETVVDANASDVLRRYFGGDAGSGEVAAKIEEVRSEMKAAMIPLVLNVSKMAKILDKFDTEGLPAERTA